MALGSEIVWEIDSTGDANNGGGFDPVSGTPGTDYTQGAGVETIVWAASGGDFTNDLASTSASSWLVLTSAARNFIAADVGNIINIQSGTNFTVGRYRIVSVAANEATLDRACGSTGDASTGAGILGGAVVDITAIDPLILAGHIIYVKSDFSLPGAVGLPSGTALLPVQVIGYNTSRTIIPIGDDRPLITCGTQTLTFVNFTIIKNLRFVGSGSNVVVVNSQNFIINCKAENTSSSADRDAFQAGSGGYFVDCEAISQFGVAFELSSLSSLTFCLAHDSKTGCLISSSGSISFCIFDSCKTGVQIQTANHGQGLRNSNFVNCVTGISLGSTWGVTVESNIFESNLEAFKSTTANIIHYFNYNQWANNTKDIILDGSTEDNSLQGIEKTTHVIKFNSDVSIGTDGATNASPGTTFTAASNPFSGALTSDVLVVKTIGTLGVYKITSVDGAGQLTLTTSPGNSLSGVTYGIVKGSDLSLQSSSGSIDAARSMLLGVGA